MTNQIEPKKKIHLCHGVGISDIRVSVNGKHITSYTCWQDMLKRCYSDRCQKAHPTYIGCSVCEEWLTFSNFKRWYDEHYREGYQLDKDILVPGNKVYSPETCRMVPSLINRMLHQQNSRSRPYKQGVYRRVHVKLDGTEGIRYAALVEDRTGDKRHKFKAFSTPEEAQDWYAETKRSIVRRVAQQALDAGDIEQDVFDALVARTFSGAEA